MLIKHYNHLHNVCRNHLKMYYWVNLNYVRLHLNEKLVQSQVFTIINDEEKQQTLRFKTLEPAKTESII